MQNYSDDNSEGFKAQEAQWLLAQCKNDLSFLSEGLQNCKQQLATNPAGEWYPIIQNFLEGSKTQLMRLLALSSEPQFSDSSCPSESPASRTAGKGSQFFDSSLTQLLSQIQATLSSSVSGQDCSSTEELSTGAKQCTAESQVNTSPAESIVCLGDCADSTAYFTEDESASNTS